MVEQPAGLELRLLGRFVVLRGGAEIPPAAFGGRKVRALLRVLATRRGEFLPHDLLADALWGQRPPADPAANLQVLVNRIRRAVGDPRLVLTGAGGYALTDDARVTIDIDQLVTALRSAHAVGDYRAAFATFRGEPLAEDRDEPWAAAVRDEVARARQDTYERAAQLALDCGDVSSAVEFAGAATAAEPLREPAVLLLLRSLAAAGDRASALTHYDRFRRDLADELGVDPSDAAQQLHAELLHGGASGAAAVATALRPDGPGRLRFVGRAKERDRIRRALRDHRLAALAGVSGAGKSRLLHELDVGPHVAVRASWPERDEAWSLTRLIVAELLAADVQLVDALPPAAQAALAAVVPDVVRPPDADPVDPESRRALAVEAVIRLARASGELVIVVDDAQWADPTSLDVLAATIDRVSSASVLMAHRSDEVPPHLAAFLRRTEADVIALGALDAEDIAALIADDDVTAALLDSTDRTPMAVTQVVQGLAAAELVEPARDGRWHSIGGDVAARARELGALGQRRAIARRVSAQPDGQRQVLELLALLGRPAAARTVADAMAAPEADVLDALGALAGSGLARLDEDGWRTAHDMVAEVVAESLDTATRAGLHSRIAGALADGGGEAGEVARHWQRAGDRQRTVTAFADAAATALDAFADVEAAALAEAGLDAEPGPAVAARLREIRGQARRRQGDIAGARSDLRAAVSLHGRGAARARVLAELASLASGADDLVRASELAELAVVESGEDAAARALALQVASVIDMNLGRPERAQQRSSEALEIFGSLGDSRGAARILDARAMATFLDGDIPAGADLLDRAANLFEDSGDLLRSVTPRSTYGHALVFLGRAGGGLDAATHAYETAHALGHPEGQAYSLWHAAEALVALGRADDARQAAERSLAIATRIGHRGWTVTAWRATGIAALASGDVDAALAAFRSSLDAAENLDLFAAWAAARCALVLVVLGRLDEAATYVARALGHGPPLGQYEARLADVELAAARGDADAATRAHHALELARRGGYQVHVTRLAALAAR